MHLGNDLDNTSGLLDLLLCECGNEPSLDNERLVDSALAQLYHQHPWQKSGVR
jgi:hypothetical protein